MHGPQRFSAMIYSRHGTTEQLDQIFFWLVAIFSNIVVFLLMVFAAISRKKRITQEEEVFMKLYQEELNVDLNKFNDFAIKNDIIEGLREELKNQMGRNI